MPVVTPVQIRFGENEIHALDDYRRAQANPPSRAAAGRELIRRALIEQEESARAMPKTAPHSRRDA
jgi:hypothetical protein